MVFYNITLHSCPEPIKKYEEISKGKHKYKQLLFGTDSVKSSTYNIIKECYQLYETKKEHLEDIFAYPNFKSSEKEALLHCYSGNTKLVKVLKEDIIKSQNIFYRTRCAYCGLNETKYIDHYLPKDKFPEFSIHIYNLVPCCSYCNEKKKDCFLDNMGIRKVYNPYFDKIEELPIIVCKLECLEDTLKSKLIIREDAVNEVCKNHLTTLGLIKRYEEQIPRILSSIIYDLIGSFEGYGTDSSGAKHVMKRTLKEVERLQGHNSLDALVYRAYLESNQLFDVNYLKRIYNKMNYPTSAPIV